MVKERKSRHKFEVVAVCIFILVALVTAMFLLKKSDLSSTYWSIYNKPTTNTSAEMKIKGLLKPIAAEGFPKGVHAVVLPRVELLSGVLSQTSWMNKRGPKGSGNKYYRKLKEFFSKYKGHEAIQIAEKLTKSGFTYDAPPNFILSLKELPDLQPEVEYTDYLLTRANGKKNLEEFAAALSDLSREMDFPSFFEAHRSELQGYVDKSVSGFESEKIINWMQEFYGQVSNKGEFYIVFAPAMFPQGGYAASIPHPDGKVTVYQVIRENGMSEDEVEFSTGEEMELLALHEWGHAYVNPSVEENSTLFGKYQINRLYRPVEDLMKKQAYGNVNTFMNEQVLRSVVAIAAKELYGDAVYQNILKREKQNGFYLTAFTTAQLEYYQRNKNQYKSFKDFVPYLLEQYSNNIDNLLEQAPK